MKNVNICFFKMVDKFETSEDRPVPPSSEKLVHFL